MYKQIARNKRISIYFTLAFLGLVLALGGLIGYTYFGDVLIGVILATLIGSVYVIINLLTATKVTLALNRAKKITSRDQAPILYDIVEDMALVAKIPMPKIYIVDEHAPNAFAAGLTPKTACVAVTTGLLSSLNREELEGVIAHEVSHIQNYDVRLMTVVLALVSLLVITSQLLLRFSYIFGLGRNSNDRNNNSNNPLALVFLVLTILGLVLAPIIGTIIQFSISRNREYLADASAVELTRNPQGLIQALKKISQYSNAPQQEVPEAYEMLYFSTLKNKKQKKDFFATHPPIEERIKRLESM